MNPGNHFHKARRPSQGIPKPYQPKPSDDPWVPYCRETVRHLGFKNSYEWYREWIADPYMNHVNSRYVRALVKKSVEDGFEPIGNGASPTIGGMDRITVWKTKQLSFDDAVNLWAQQRMETFFPLAVSRSIDVHDVDLVLDDVRFTAACHCAHAALLSLKRSTVPDGPPSKSEFVIVDYFKNCSRASSVVDALRGRDADAVFRAIDAEFEHVPDAIRWLPRNGLSTADIAQAIVIWALPIALLSLSILEEVA